MIEQKEKQTVYYRVAFVSGLFAHFYEAPISFTKKLY